jgi:cell wall-associated NlpC family hydrolase
VIELPGLPPPVQQPQLPTPPPRETPSRAPVPPPPAESYRRLANRVGQLGVVQVATPITRLPTPYVRPLAQVAPGTYVVVKAQKDGWCAVLMIDNSIGWIPAPSVRLLQADVVRRGAGPQPGDGDDDPDAVPSAPGFGGDVLREAYRYLGVRYRWGGNGFSGVDCSGLVKNCFARLGVSLPRTASTQVRVGAPVAFTDLEPGDRLYFAVKGSRIDHTGIYIGNDHFIHASMSSGKVAVDKLSRPLFARSLDAARRTIASLQ